jgi:hypothetical protein
MSRLQLEPPLELGLSLPRYQGADGDVAQIIANGETCRFISNGGYRPTGQVASKWK